MYGVMLRECTTPLSTGLVESFGKNAVQPLRKLYDQVNHPTEVYDDWFDVPVLCESTR